MSFRKIIQLIVGRRKYFLKLKNWGDLLLIALIVIVLYVSNESLNDPLKFSLPQHFENVCEKNETSTPWRESHITIKNHLAVKRALAAFERFYFQMYSHYMCVEALLVSKTHTARITFK